MPNVIDMQSRRKKKAHKACKPNGQDDFSGRKSAPRIDRQTYELWMLSQDVDALIVKAVASNELNLEEVAAILAHRLGTLIQRSEHPEKLVTFCRSLLERLQGGPGDSDTPTRVG